MPLRLLVPIAVLSLIAVTRSQTGESFNFTCEPLYPLVHLGSPEVVRLEFATSSRSFDELNTTSPASTLGLRLTCHSNDVSVFTVHELTAVVKMSETGVDGMTYVATLRLRGQGIGQKVMNCELSSSNSSDSSTVVFKRTFRTFVTVTKSVGVFDVVFRIVANMVIVVLSLAMGCQIDLKVVKHSLSRPLAPAIGFFCQFVCMPLISLAVIHTFGLNGAFAFGLFTLGCAPGGGHSNFYTLIFDGNVSLSITMTFISNMAALFMMPAWLMTIGNHLLTESSSVDAFTDKFSANGIEGVSVGVAKEEIHIPFIQIVASILLNTVPLVSGVLIAKKRPLLAEKIRWFLKPMIIFTLIFFFVCGTYLNFHLLKMITMKMVAICCCLPYFGFLIGLALAKVACRTYEDVICIAFETGIQNLGIAIVICINTLPHPQEEMAWLALIVIAMISPIPIYLAILIRTIKNLIIVKNEKIELSTEVKNCKPKDCSAAKDIDCKYSHVEQI